MDIPPATISCPTYIPSADWKSILEICTLYNVNPYLIAAIGWHETHWGKLGAGRSGYILGVGVHSDTDILTQYKGLPAQLNWAVPRLAKAFGLHPTEPELDHFAHQIWKPGNPTAWASSVWDSLEENLTNFSPGFNSFTDIPTWAREPIAAMLRLRFVTTPFGSNDFYRSVTVDYSMYNDLRALITAQKE